MHAGASRAANSAAGLARLTRGALVFTVLAAAAFLITRPPVGDLWAAEARESAAAHGVGLTYWFSWFGGTVPGHYSVLAPLATRLVDAGVLGAVATVVIVVLAHGLVGGSRHSTTATWAAAVAACSSLWSGRVPFAAGTAVALVALLCVRAQRRWLAGCAGIAAGLVSPVSGAFLILGLSGVLVHDRRHRVDAGVAAGASAVTLVALAAYFGVPGPQGFPASHAALAGATLLLMLLARPARLVRTVVFISLPVLLLAACVPNGMGTNLERFIWLCLPIATIATAEVRLGRAAVTSGAALVCALVGSANDLVIAAAPMSSEAYLQQLIAHLDRTPGLADYRVEVVPDGTRVAAYAMLDHAMLARGYETQSDNALNAMLDSPDLDATSYREWLDDNAVGYVALDRVTLKSGPEDRLVRSGHVPYLQVVWSDAHWQLFKVDGPIPIIDRPARITEAGQAALKITTPTPARLTLRVRWSRFLHVTGPAGARLVADGSGWSILEAPVAGRYRISAG